MPATPRSRPRERFRTGASRCSARSAPSAASPARRSAPKSGSSSSRAPAVALGGSAPTSLHLGTPLRRDGPAVTRRGQQDGGERLLERAHRQLRVAVAGGDRLALLGDADAAADRAARLRRGWRGACARRRGSASHRARGTAPARVRRRPPARRAAPARSCSARCSSTNPESLPESAGTRSMIVPVAVAAQAVAVDGRVVQRRHRLRRLLEVGERLEQRREPQLRACAARRARAPRARRTAPAPSTGPSPGRRACRSARARARRCRARAQLAGRAGRAPLQAAPLLGDRLVQQPQALRLARAGVAGQQERRDGLLEEQRRSWRTSRLATWKPNTSICHVRRRRLPGGLAVAALHALRHEPQSSRSSSGSA